MGGRAEGIGKIDRNSSDAPLGYQSVVAMVSSPSFLARRGDTVYAVDEAAGRVDAFTDDSGCFHHLGGQPTSGSFPCHLTVEGSWLYAANYGSGGVDVFPLDERGRIGLLHQTLIEHGTLGPHPAQDGSHAHATLVIDDVVLVANLGTDSIIAYEWSGNRLVTTGTLATPPGTGPRDFAVTPEGRVWALGELSGNILLLDGFVGGPGTGIPAMGAAARAAVVPVIGDHAAGLAVGAGGRFLYTGLRGSNRIAVVRTDDLSPVADVDCGGDWPRHLTVAGGLLYVACERSSTVSIFEIDEGSGIPTLIGEPLTVPTPTFLLANPVSDRRVDFAEARPLVR